MDLKGLPCPQPTLKMTIKANSLKPGDMIEAVADCGTFVDDVKGWCARLKKTLMWIKDEGNAKRVLVQQN